MDWNGDGHLDALLGGYGGDVMLFLGKSGGGFGVGAHLTFADGTDFVHLIPQGKPGAPKEPKEDAGAMIWCVDWDQDGDYDILSGWFFGGIFLSRNVGSKTEPKLSPTFEALSAGDGHTKWGYQVQPCMADWDGDGRLDLIFSSQVSAKSGQGSVSWCRNLSTSGEPRLGPPQVLVWSGPSTQVIAPQLGLERVFGGYLAAVPMDWDGDGAVDLIVSDMAYLVKPRADLAAEDQERLKQVSAAMVNESGAVAVTATDGERRASSRKLTEERVRLTESMPRQTKRGLLWLVRRQPKSESK